MDVIVEATRGMMVEKMLRERQIPFQVTIHNVPDEQVVTPTKTGLDKSTVALLVTPKQSHDNIIDWQDFYPLNKIYEFMESLEKQHPSICTVLSIGQTVEGRQIKLLKISNSDARNTGVWIDGCLHAREWIGVCVATYIAQYVASNFDNLPQHLTNKDWHFLPVANPDGYHHSYTVDRLWRKNRARIGKTIVGVDLNRNFGFAWAKNASDSISGDPAHINYRGNAPFSEPEAAAIKDIILYSSTPFKIFLTLHSFSEVICFPWCYTNDPCPDYVALLEGATVMAKAIYETNGLMYKVGNFKDMMYYASGTSIDWSYGTVKIPFTYLIELRGKQHKFLLPKQEIYDCCVEILNGVKALTKFADKQKC